eukprot:TRINITY_DN677_c0_g1_i1.p1 TRINITY_DN677_c0_g1~~TRINITY_DN677_c0_g1_i1.p1  ORF type:complete len:449 (+),score=126.85 TRINITY_DN677_c0_g1_i1:127-1347(+)
MSSLATFPTVKEVKTFTVGGLGDGGDYHNQKNGHWITGTGDFPISNPMSRYEDWKASRTSWGINVLGSFVIEITASDGRKGVATGFGGAPACWLVKNHFERFLLGADPRNTNLLWDQMWSASMFYGRKGLPIAVISVVDLALWDLVGKIRNEPVYKMIGGAVKKDLKFYCTGPNPPAIKGMGFFGAKVPLPYGPEEPGSIQKNVSFLKKHKESVGEDFPIMVDCWMSLNVQYAITLASACKKAGVEIEWWEEVLHPDDFDGYQRLKQAHPDLKWTTGEHEYSRYGFRKLIEGRNIDILQPDVMWCGGLTELLRISAMASAYDIPVVPHGSGPYSAHFVITQTNAPFTEYIANSPDGKSVFPVFGKLFTNEAIPINGVMNASVLDAPGFGLELNPEANLVEFKSLSQ